MGLVPKIVDHDERRRLIVEALWRVVSRGGAAAVSVRNVAAEAGMPKSSIGHYVGTQPELIGLAVTQLVQHVTDQVINMDPMNMTEESAVDTVMLAIPTDPHRRQMSEVWLLLLSQRNAEPDLVPILTSLNVTVLDGLREVLSGMQISGLLGQDVDLDLEARRLHALVDGLSVQSMTDPDFMPPAEVRRVVAAHLAELRSRFPVLTA